MPALLISILKLEPSKTKTAFGRRLTLVVWKVSWVLSGIVATLIALAVAYFGLQYFGGLLGSISLRVWVAGIAIILVVFLAAALQAFAKTDRFITESRSEIRDLRASMRDLEQEIQRLKTRGTVD